LAPDQDRSLVEHRIAWYERGTGPGLRLRSPACDCGRMAETGATAVAGFSIGALPTGAMRDCGLQERAGGA
jgi:hypothetical protein